MKEYLNIAKKILIESYSNDEEFDIFKKEDRIIDNNIILKDHNLEIDENLFLAPEVEKEAIYKTR